MPFLKPGRERLSAWIFLALAAAFLAAAARSAEEKATPGDGHFPLAPGMRWTYESNLGEVSSWVEASGEERRVISTSSSLDTEQRLRVAPDGVYLLAASSKVLFFSTERTYRPPLLRLPLPIQPGQSWSWSGTETVDGDEIQTAITGKAEAEEKVAVPAGEFSCLRVRVDTVCSDGTTASSVQWLARGVGIVKAEIAVDAGGLSGFLISLIGMDRFTLELKEIKKD